MSQYWMLIAILLPIVGGILVKVIPFSDRRIMKIYLECIMIVTSVIVFLLAGMRPQGKLEVVHFMQDLSISFRIDGMSMVFSVLVAALWPLAMLYSFEYMEHEKHQRVFFMFYSITYGVTLGISYASDMLSMYFFYELLTLVTVPLILHSLSRQAIHATRKYLYYSLGGAAFALIGIVFLMVYGNQLDFVMGGVLNLEKIGDKKQVLLVVYLIACMGFGVKAAMWPMGSWLPDAGVAPTPVTALLHAVAVVKAGVFAIIRLTYYSFGTDFLRGTWVQAVVMAFAMFSIVYGCTRAVMERHIKRRLAYSTISNLSYIIFSAAIMTPLGLVGALTHMICHACMKICSFLCAGAVMHQTEKMYIDDLNGYGRKMPVVFGCFTVSALGLMGVPGLAGFISKWNIAKAAVASERLQAYLGIGCLLISAFLTSIYMMSIVFRAYFPGRNFHYEDIEEVKDPSWRMCLPLMLFALAVICLGLFSGPLVRFFTDVASGMY